MRVLRRLSFASSDPERDVVRVRHIFYGHVLTANSPPLHVRVDGGRVILDLDVRIYDNYAVDAAVKELARTFPDLREEAQEAARPAGTA